MSNDPNASSYNPSEVFRELVEGYNRFKTGTLKHPYTDSKKILEERKKMLDELAKKQFPKICVLACADSRVPPEIIFDQDLGDMFVVRVAGNFADIDNQASLEYALQHFTPPPAIIIVLGHERCGAIQAAAITFDELSVWPADVEKFKHHPSPSGNVVSLVMRLQQVILKTMGDTPTTEDEYKLRLDEAVRQNVMDNVATLQSNTVIKGYIENYRTFVIGARYDLDDGIIEWLTQKPAMWTAPPSTANVVYGQGDDLTTRDSNNDENLYEPWGVTLDSSRNLYVADTSNNRVLFFPEGSKTAERVYGLGTEFPSADTLLGPGGVALDSGGNLYVADRSNHRVLFFPAGSTTAERVYGQNSLLYSSDENKDGVSNKSLYAPSGVALDGSSNLYVADALNNRVLFYPAGSTTATRVYGQGDDFNSNEINKDGISDKSLYEPSGVALDSSRNLYVADTGNHRVLFFPEGSNIATRVYGQGVSGTDFNSNQENKDGISNKSLWYPTGIALDDRGNLYVTDINNNRVLFYPEHSTIATRVYGQNDNLNACDYTDEVSGKVLNTPKGVAVDNNGNLYIADTYNNRVLKFNATFTESESTVGAAPTSGQDHH